MSLDWDVHHGNGTNDIFYGRADVLFASIHQWPLYPGTGQLCDVGIAEAGFAGMTASLRRVCASVSAPLGLVLEGGYAVNALAESVAALAPVLAASEPPPGETIALHPLVEQAAQRLERFWPSVPAAL